MIYKNLLVVHALYVNLSYYDCRWFLLTRTLQEYLEQNITYNTNTTQNTTITVQKQ